MKYIVKLHSNDKIMSGVTFDNEIQTFLHIGKVITDSKTPIEVGVERLYLAKDGVETLTAIVYHLYECERE